MVIMVKSVIVETCQIGTDVCTFYQHPVYTNREKIKQLKMEIQLAF